jgi:hypothetical protein
MTKPIPYRTMEHRDQSKLTAYSQSQSNEVDVTELNGKMEETVKKPQSGAWDEMPTEEPERKPQLKWDMDDSHTLTIKCDRPKEYTSGDGNGVFYVFDCEKDGEEMVFFASAWSLLRGLRMLGEQLMDKKVTISKKMVNGKQTYEVVEA